MPDSQTADLSEPPDDPLALLGPIGPINPVFMQEAVRTLMRGLPLDPQEPAPWMHRRMHCALMALSALYPRDEIEVMLAVQALCAYHAAAAAWYLGMNLRRPCGDNHRHVATASTAARSFDILLRALERRQAKPLSPPPGRPPPRAWTRPDSTAVIEALTAGAVPARADPAESVEAVWPPRQRELAEQIIRQEQITWENEGLDIANTHGILPGGGMIVPANPTLHQKAYMGRRLTLAMRQEYQSNLQKGLTGAAARPKIRAFRVGDLIP